MKRLILVAISVMLSPMSISAQVSSSSTSMGMSAPLGLGNGFQSPLRFAGEVVPTNQVSLSMGAMTFYNDNVFNENSNRVGDEGVQFNSQLAFVRNTQNLLFNFTYLPNFFLYRDTTQYDRVNHAGSLNVNCNLSPRWGLNLNDSVSYQNGIFQSLVGQQITSGLGSPTAINQSVYPYTSRTLMNSSGMDLVFEKSNRTSMSISGGYNMTQFGSGQAAGQSLYNTRSAIGGFQLQHRFSEHTSFGFSLLHEDSTYRGGTGLGSIDRYQTESALLSFQSHFTPTVTISLYGGTQYVTTFGEVQGVGSTKSFQGAGGGSITKEVRRTAINLSVQRRASDSGGLYGQVEYTSALIGVRRRLVGHWQASFSGSANRIDTTASQSGSGRTNSLQGSFELDRPLGNNTNFRISYENAHQLSSGSLPISANSDLNVVTLGIDFRLKAIPIGH